MSVFATVFNDVFDEVFGNPLGAGLLDPLLLRAGATTADGLALKPGLTSAAYDHDGAATAPELKRGLRDGQGNLKPSMLDGNGNLKRSWLK